MMKMPIQKIYDSVESFDYDYFINKITEQRNANPSISLNEYKRKEYNLNDFLKHNDIPNLLSVYDNNWRFDLFFKNYECADKLYIIFSGSRKLEETTVFRRHSWNYFFDGAVLYISDPSFHKFNDIFIGWYLGDNHTNTYNTIIKIVNHVAKILSNPEIITFGSSAGGYAAIKFAQYNPCKVIAINPQLYLKTMIISKHI